MTKYQLIFVKCFVYYYFCLKIQHNFNISTSFMKKFLTLKTFKFVLIILCLPLLFQTANAQSMDRIERERMKSMLDNLKSSIKKEYYDSAYHGIDIEARFKLAKDRIEQVTTTGQGLAVIAQVLMDFNDSHLYFLPPATNLDVEYGWQLQMYGDKCYVVAVKPKSDAEAKGLKPGDQVIAVENFPPNRKDLWKMDYYYNILMKRTKLALTVLSPNAAEPRVLEIESKIIKHPNVINWQTLYLDLDPTGDDYSINKFLTVGNNITIWKMETFGIDPKDIDGLVGRAKSSNALILDLRQNRGGYVKTLERLASFIFEKDLKIADLKGRKQMDPQESKTQGKNCFTGRLIVLIDSNSASASEIFARLVQLEKRGTVIGDISAGAVMQSRLMGGTSGADAQIGYGASVTNADVIMSDGKSLENVGVTPDTILLPTSADLAAGRDPVLSKAVELLGGKLSPEDAGKFSIDFEWKKSGRFRLR